MNENSVLCLFYLFVVWRFGTSTLSIHRNRKHDNSNCNQFAKNGVMRSASYIIIKATLEWGTRRNTGVAALISVGWLLAFKLRVLERGVVMKQYCQDTA